MAVDVKRMPEGNNTAGGQFLVALTLLRTFQQINSFYCNYTPHLASKAQLDIWQV